MLKSFVIYSTSASGVFRTIPLLVTDFELLSRISAVKRNVVADSKWKKIYNLREKIINE